MYRGNMPPVNTGYQTGNFGYMSRLPPNLQFSPFDGGTNTGYTGIGLPGGFDGGWKPGIDPSRMAGGMDSMMNQMPQQGWPMFPKNQVNTGGFGQMAMP